MTDPTQAGQPTEEELRAYLEQLRAADPAEVIVQAYRMLGTGAEVKLGRDDARVLIDALHGLVEAVGDRLPGDLGQQMRDGVAQLQMAQVQAERQAGAEGAGDPAAQDRDAPAGAEPGAAGAGAAGQGPSGGERPRPGQQPPRPGGQAGQRMTDRLWIPGRDPGPR